MIKILELLGEPIGSGGEESFIINVLSHMNLKEMNIDVLTPYFCQNLYYKTVIEKLGGNVFELHQNFAPGKSRLNIIKPLDLFLKYHKYDVVHIHSGSMSVLAIASFCAKKNRVGKILVHSHSTSEKNTIKKKILRTLTGCIMYFCVDYYLSCSIDAGRDKFFRSVVNNNLIVIKNGIDLNKFCHNDFKRKKMRYKLNLSPNTFVLGHVGRFTKSKNHEFILAVFLQLKLKKTDSKLLLVGEGELFSTIQQKTVQMGLKNDVIFTGAVNNVYDYMQAMDAFIFPSLFEGLGMVALEAQAVGIPTYISDNCPHDVLITDYAHMVSLNTSTEKWASLILNPHCIIQDGSSDIRQAGFDINDTAEVIRKRYFEN